MISSKLCSLYRELGDSVRELCEFLVVLLEDIVSLANQSIVACHLLSKFGYGLCCISLVRFQLEDSRSDIWMVINIVRVMMISAAL